MYPCSSFFPFALINNSLISAKITQCVTEWEVDPAGKSMEAEVVVRVQEEGRKGEAPQASTLTLVVNGTPPYPVEGKCSMWNLD